MINYIKKVFALLSKDLRIEFRTKDSFNSMFVFALLMIVIFNYAFDLTRKETLEIASGILWIAFTFSGILGLNRSFSYEKENSAIEGIILSPVDRSAIYLGKFLSNFLIMLLFEVVLLPFFVIFFNLKILSDLPILFLVMLLGTWGFVSVGTIFSAISVQTKMREIMLPLLLFPIAVPVIIGAVESTSYIIQEENWQLIWLWIQRLIGINVIYFTISFILFEYVIVE
jgi:heme exporter protein B